MNGTLFNYNWLFVAHESDITRPPRTVVICDSTDANWLSTKGPTVPTTGIFWNSEWNWNDGLGLNYSARPAARHNGMIDIVWCDGHVSAKTLADLMSVQPGYRPKGCI